MVTVIALVVAGYRGERYLKYHHYHQRSLRQVRCGGEASSELFMYVYFRRNIVQTLMFLLHLCGCLHLSASVKTKAYVGTLKLNTTDNAPHTDSPLPFFKFLNTGNEGGAGFAIPPDLSIQPVQSGGC